MATRRIVILGSTGSIGTSALDVIAHLNRLEPGRYQVVGLAAGRNAALLGEQARDGAPGAVAIEDGDADLTVPAGTTVYRGADAARELVAAHCRAGDLVIAAIVGVAGLPAVLDAIDAGCDIALANKETLVAAGAIVMPRAAARGVRILPVDSEHNALHQALRAGRGIDEVERLVLTASGGPFRTWDAARIAAATPDDALAHPTWDMGRKVSIDSASLMNKGLELIEAHWLFGLPSEQLDAIVHPQSLVHSFVEFRDGSVIAQLSPPDMRLPIQYALTWPDRAPGNTPKLDWTALRQLDFEPIDHDRFPLFDLARRVIDTGGSSGAIYNAAGEIAVEAFLDRRIPFGRIAEIVDATMDAVPVSPIDSLAACLDADRRARDVAATHLTDPAPSA